MKWGVVSVYMDGSARGTGSGDKGYLEWKSGMLQGRKEEPGSGRILLSAAETQEGRGLERSSL
jgi:hypothetical protein